jgi:copper transport protein
VIHIVTLVQAVAQSAQEARPPVRPEPGFSTIKALAELIQFVGYFLAVGAVGFRFGVVRRARGMSDEARAILRADNAALLGIFGVLLLTVATLSGPFLQSVTQHKTFAASLPKNLGPFEFKLVTLTLALVGFALIRATPPLGWALAVLGVLFTVVQPLYTGKLSSKVNAVHVLAASTWLGTLLVLTVIGIRGVIRSSSAGQQRAELIGDLVNSFSPLALIAATIVGITGVTTAWLHLKRISSLYTTSYGLALVVKLILVGIVMALGAWNWKRVRPSLGGEGTDLTIRRSATMELAFAALVLIATSVLVTLPSPR